MGEAKGTAPGPLGTKALVRTLVGRYYFFLPAVLLTGVWWVVIAQPAALVALLILTCPVYLVGAQAALGVLREGLGGPLLRRALDLGFVLLVYGLILGVLFLIVAGLWGLIGEPGGRQSGLLGWVFYSAVVAVLVVRVWPAYTLRMVHPWPVDERGRWLGWGGLERGPGLRAAWRMTGRPGVFREYGLGATISLVFLVGGMVWLAAARADPPWTVQGHVWRAAYVLLGFPLIHLALVDRTHRLLVASGSSPPTD